MLKGNDWTLFKQMYSLNQNKWKVFDERSLAWLWNVFINWRNFLILSINWKKWLVFDFPHKCTFGEVDRWRSSVALISFSIENLSSWSTFDTKNIKSPGWAVALSLCHRLSHSVQCSAVVFNQTRNNATYYFTCHNFRICLTFTVYFWSEILVFNKSKNYKID